MKKYFYLVATPESLIVSHLAPAEFGNYLAVGTKKQLRGQAMYFEIDPDKNDFPGSYIDAHLVPYANGEPKRSVYLSIYRALEKTPLDSFKNLYLATDDGKVLEIEPGVYEEGSKYEIHLYQQFNPITTQVASKLTPPEFISFLTDTSKPVSAPKLFFAELRLDGLSSNPLAPLHNLPYRNPGHLRECLLKLDQSPERKSKTVLRFMNEDLSYRTIKSGFFIGKKNQYLFYPFPSEQELENKHYSWWRSALAQHV